MAGTLTSRTAAQILVDALKIHGVDTAFCVPGESYLAVLDALYDAREAIRLIVARQDGGAAYMAEAWAKVTGRPGICFVTRGPGATNASIGVHTAQQDSTPMILFIGQVPGEFADRESFQEMDYRQMFGPMSKWVAQIERADRMHEYVSHAFHLAMSGRPGPVVLALPEDMLTQTAAVADVSPYQVVQASPSAGDLEKLRALLAQAKRPLVILGGTVWTREACRDLQAFAESSGLPIACSFRFQDLFDNRHGHYVGDVGIGINPKLAERVRGADLLLVIGARLRDDHGRLHAGRAAAAEAEARARARGRRGTRSGLPGRAADQFRHAADRRRAERHEAGRFRVARLARAGTRRLSRVDETHREPGKGSARRDRHLAARASPRGRDHRQRRGEFRWLDLALLPLSGPAHAGRADQRLDGLRRSGRRRGESRASGARRRLDKRRRRLPYERARNCHGGAVRAAGDIRRRQQRDVRDDTHASGARLPGTRLWYGPAEPGFRGPRARIRRDRGGDGAVRTGLRTRRAGNRVFRQTGADRGPHRPAGDYDLHDARRHSRARAQGLKPPPTSLQVGEVHHVRRDLAARIERAPIGFPQPQTFLMLAGSVRAEHRGAEQVAAPFVPALGRSREQRAGAREHRMRVARRDRAVQLEPFADAGRTGRAG